MTRSLLARAFGAALFILAGAHCGKAGGGGGSGGGNGMPSVFGDFGDGGGKKWEGAWVVGKGDFGGQAWEVKGNDVTVSDGGTDKKYKLALASPCSVGIVEGTMTQTYSYVWDGDTLYAGMGAAGFKKGNDAIVCGAGKFSDVFLIKGGKCQACKEDMMHKGSWSCEAAECSLGADTFEATTKFMDQVEKKTLKVQGNLILSDQMAGNKAEKVADLATAKAALKK